MLVILLQQLHASISVSNREMFYYLKYVDTVWFYWRNSLITIKMLVECHKIVSVYTLETLNTVTTWNDITHSMFWKNAMLYTAGCNSVVILPIPRISFWLTHLPLEQLKILDNHLSSFHCRECDSVLATEIWERSLNRPLRKNLSPHRTSTGGNLPLPSNVINPCPSRERGNHLVTVK